MPGWWSGGGAGVGGEAPVRGSLCGFLVSSSFDAGFAPALAAQRHELLAFVGHWPGRCLLPVDRRAAFRYVLGHANEGHVPADAHGTGSELGPALVVDVRKMLELQPCR